VLHATTGDAAALRHAHQQRASSARGVKRTDV